MFNGKIHYKWSFSIAILNYQRVSNVWMNSRKNHHLGQRRGFEVAGNCSNLISTILVDEIQNIPLLLPLFNGRSKPCGCDSIPKIDLDPLHPLNPWTKIPCVLQIIYQFADGSKPSKPIYYHMSRTSKHSSYFTDQFKPAGMIFLQFFSFLPYLTAPAFNLGNAERPQRWDGSCPKEGGKINHQNL
jgi:hypothetical protein